MNLRISELDCSLRLQFGVSCLGKCRTRIVRVTDSRNEPLEVRLSTEYRTFPARKVL